MPPTAAQIEERIPVWEALSAFFLDTQLREEDYTRIAGALAASSFSVEELADILAFEVCPACRGNMREVAGEWTGFDRAWLKERIAPRLGRRPLVHFGFRDRWMYRNHWSVVRERITVLRHQGARAQESRTG